MTTILTSHRDIVHLWRLAGQRYAAAKDRIQNTLQGHTLWRDMPTEPGQVVCEVWRMLHVHRRTYITNPLHQYITNQLCTPTIHHLKVVHFDGKAALFLDVSLISRFSKQFTIDQEALELIGRVDVGKGWLGNTLYPLYFTVTPKPVTVKGMGLGAG